MISVTNHMLGVDFSSICIYFWDVYLFTLKTRYVGFFFHPKPQIFTLLRCEDEHPLLTFLTSLLLQGALKPGIFLCMKMLSITMVSFWQRFMEVTAYVSRMV